MDAPVKALNTEKAKALQAALQQIEKQFGKGSIMRLGEGEVIEDIQVVSTGSLGLDIALGVGGLQGLGFFGVEGFDRGVHAGLRGVGWSGLNYVRQLDIRTAIAWRQVQDGPPP